MAIWQEVRPRFRRAAAPAAAIVVLCYFGYHAFEGDHGLKAWLQLSAQKAKLTEQVAVVSAKRHHLEKRVHLLEPDSLDPDMVSEQARIVLGYTQPDEVVIFDRKSAQ